MKRHFYYDICQRFSQFLVRLVAGKKKIPCPEFGRFDKRKDAREAARQLNKEAREYQ